MRDSAATDPRGRLVGLRARRPWRFAAGLLTAGLVAWVAVGLRAAALRARAESAARAARWDEAEAALARLAWYGRLDIDSQRLRAAAAERRGDPVAAARLRMAIPADHPSASAERVRAGALLLGAFRLGEAEAAYRAALAIDRRSEEALRALVVICGVERRARDQEEALWALHDLGGTATAIEALRLLAPGVPVIPPDSLPREIDEAQLLRRARESDPRDAWATIALADLLRSRGEADAARGLLIGKPVVEGDRPWFWAWGSAWGRLLLDEGRDAELAFLIDRWPGGGGDASGWLALVGSWRAEQGRFGEAAEAFRGAVRADPRDPRNRYRLARALRSAGNEKEAEREEAAFRAAEELKAVASEIDEEAPDPVLMARAAELCETAGRQREARAWRELVGRSGPR
jgi:tetratricopeptide (TPR) repeat protein